jgi:hypothetical protein
VKDGRRAEKLFEFENQAGVHRARGQAQLAL